MEFNVMYKLDYTDEAKLKGDRAGQWSRHITKRHRLVYEIHDAEVVVLVLTTYGHYDDK